MTEAAQKKPILRIVLFAVVLFIMMGVLIRTLYDLTVVHGEDYLRIASSEATNTIVTKGRRGAIFDRNGLARL